MTSSCMTSFNHTINQINQLQYNFSVFCESFDSLCLDMSKILDYFYYLLTYQRTYYYRIHLPQRISSLEYFVEITLKTESFAFRLQQ